MSNTTSVQVILINRSLPYNCIGKLTGLSGVEYGYSTYEAAFGAHACRLTLEEWEACAKDVTLGSARRWQQWEAHFELPEFPVGGEDVIALIRNSSGDALDAIVSSLSPLVQAVYARAKETAQPVAPEIPGPAVSNFVESTSPIAPHESDDLDAVTNFRSLLKMAKAAGVADADSINTSDGLRDAIRAARPATARPAASAESFGIERHEYKGSADGKMVDLPEPEEARKPAFQGGNAS